jgi:hypothetical protein
MKQCGLGESDNQTKQNKQDLKKMLQTLLSALRISAIISRTAKFAALLYGND